MAQYTIDLVGPARPWQTADGNQFVSYDVTLVGEVEPCELVQRPQTAPPQRGQALEGEIRNDNQGRRKFKKAQQPRPGGAGRSPEDQRSIVRQHSQDMALRALELGFNMGVLEKPSSSRELMDLVSKTSDWFERDAAPVRQTQAVKAQAELDRVVGKERDWDANGGGAAVPQSQPAVQPQPAVAVSTGDDIPFARPRVRDRETRRRDLFVGDRWAA